MNRTRREWGGAGLPIGSSTAEAQQLAWALDCGYPSADAPKKGINTNQGFSEVFTADGLPRPHYGPLVSSLEAFTRSEIERRERLQTLALISQGVTFTVYGEKEGLERIFPFDFVPRIISAGEWKTIQDGLVQRITALNLFLLDIYQAQTCLRDHVIPAEPILSRREFKRSLLGIVPPRKIFTHVVGTDIIRDDRGQYLVLEFFSPTAGWVPFDPTHHRALDERYVVVGHGRHYDDVPPNKGIFRGNAREALRAEVLTGRTAPKAIATLHEELEHIDLPVFQEIPARTHDWASTVADDAIAQQQQQQQQQRSG